MTMKVTFKQPNPVQYDAFVWSKATDTKDDVVAYVEGDDTGLVYSVDGTLTVHDGDVVVSYGDNRFEVLSGDDAALKFDIVSDTKQLAAPSEDTVVTTARRPKTSPPPAAKTGE